MKSFKAIFRRGQNVKLDGQNTSDNISRTSSITNLDVEQQQKGGNKGAKPKKTASRDRLDKIGEARKNDKKGVTKNNNKLESGDNAYPSIDFVQEEEFSQLRRQLQEMAQEKTNLALQLGEQKGQLNILQKEIQKLKSFQEESNNKVEYLTEENTMLRNRLRDVAHSPLSDNEKQQLLFDSHRHHSSAPASIATNLIDEGNGGDTTCTTPDWDKHSSSNVSEVSVACLQDKINQMQETHYSTNEELQATLQELTDLQRQLTELQQENERLNEEKTLMMDSLCRQTERLNESRSEVESLKQMLYQEKDDVGQFESVADREQKLVDLLKSSQEERETLMVKLEQINNELQDASSAILEKDEMIGQLAERVRTLECTLDAKHAEHKQVDQELTLVKDQCNGKQIEINRLTDLLDNAKTKIHELEQDRALSDKSELDEMLDNARKEKDALESEVAHLKEQLAISRNETEKLKEQISTLQEEVKVTRNNAKTTQSDLEYKCEKILKDKAALNEQLQEFQDAINELQVQNQCQLEDKRQLSAVLSETQRNLSEAERKHINLENEVQELKNLRSEENEEWEKFQNDLLTSVRVANDFKTEAQLELQRMILENKMYRDRERQLKAEIEKLKGQKMQEDMSGTSTSKSSNKECYIMDSLIKRPNKNKNRINKTSESHKVLLLATPDSKKSQCKPEPSLKPVKRRENKSLKNKRYKTLSVEEEVLLDSLDKWYKNIDSKLSDENLTEEERVIKKLKVIYEDDQVKTKPVAPKPKNQLAISKPLLDSVMENPKLREILGNPNVQTIEDIKGFQEHTPELRRLIQNIDRFANVKSEDLTKLTDNKRISIIGRSMSYEINSHDRETEHGPAGLYRTFYAEDLRSENTLTKNIRYSVIPNDSFSNISIATQIFENNSPNKSIRFDTLDSILLSVPKNTSHNKLTSEQKFVLKLKEALDEAKRKITLSKLANIKKLPISAPLLESIETHSSMKDIPYDPYVSYIMRRNSETILLGIQKPVTQSKSYEDIIFPLDLHSINMYSDKSCRDREKLSSLETLSSGEFNLETGCVGPYNSEIFKELEFENLSTFFGGYKVEDKIQPSSSNIDTNLEIDFLSNNETIIARKGQIRSTYDDCKELLQNVELESSLVDVQHFDLCNTMSNVHNEKSTDMDNKHKEVDPSKHINSLDFTKNINYPNKINIDIKDFEKRENVNMLNESYISSDFQYIENFIEIEKSCSCENISESVLHKTVFPWNVTVEKQSKLNYNMLSENASSLQYDTVERNKTHSDINFCIDNGKKWSILEDNILNPKLENSETIDGNNCDLTYNETLNRIKKVDKRKNTYENLEDSDHLMNQGIECISELEATRLNYETSVHGITLIDEVTASPELKVSDMFTSYYYNDLDENVEMINEDISDSFIFSNELSVPDNPVTDLDASLEIQDFTPLDYMIDFSTEMDTIDQEYDYHAILRENRYGVTSPLHLRVTFKDVIKEIKARFSKGDDDFVDFQENIAGDKQYEFYDKNSENNFICEDVVGSCDQKNEESNKTSVFVTHSNVCDELKLVDDTLGVSRCIDKEMEDILEKYLQKPVSKILSEPADKTENPEYDHYIEDQNIKVSKYIENIDSKPHYLSTFDNSDEVEPIFEISLLHESNSKDGRIHNLADIKDMNELVEITNNTDKMNDHLYDFIGSESLKDLTREQLEVIMSQIQRFSKPLTDLRKTDLEAKEINVNYVSEVKGLSSCNKQRITDHMSNIYQKISKSEPLEKIQLKNGKTFDKYTKCRDVDIDKNNIKHENDYKLIDEKDYQFSITALASPSVAVNNIKVSDDKLETLTNMDSNDSEIDLIKQRCNKQESIVNNQQKPSTSFSQFVDTIIEDNSLKSNKGQRLQNTEIKFKIHPFKLKDENQTLYQKKVKSVADHFEKISLSTNYEPVYASCSSVKLNNVKQFEKTAEKKPLPLPRSRNPVIQKSDIDFDIVNIDDRNDECLSGIKMTDLRENFSDHELENVIQGITSPGINMIEVPGLHETQKLLPEIVHQAVDVEQNKLGEVVEIRKSEKFLENHIKQENEKNVDDQHNLACGADPSFSPIAVAGKVETLDLTKTSISDIEGINTENESNLNLFHLETPSFDESYLNLYKVTEEKTLDHHGKKRLPKHYMNVEYSSEGSDNDSNEEVDRKNIGYKYFEKDACKPKIIDFVPLDDATKPVFNKDNSNKPSYDTLERETAFHILNAAGSSAKERKSLAQLETESGNGSQITSFSAAKKVFEALADASSDKKELNTFAKNTSMKESGLEVVNNTGIVNDPTNVDSNL